MMDANSGWSSFFLSTYLSIQNYIYLSLYMSISLSVRLLSCYFLLCLCYIDIITFEVTFYAFGFQLTTGSPTILARSAIINQLGKEYGAHCNWIMNKKLFMISSFFTKSYILLLENLYFQNQKIASFPCFGFKFAFQGLRGGGSWTDNNDKNQSANMFLFKGTVYQNWQNLMVCFKTRNCWRNCSLETQCTTS